MAERTITPGGQQRRLPLRVLAASLTFASIAAAVSWAADPTDPQAAQQQPLRIIRIGQALDMLGPLRDVRVLTADTGLDLDHPDIAPRLFSLPKPTKAPDSGGFFNGNPPTIPAGGHGWDLIGTNTPGDVRPDADPSDPPGGSGHGTSVAGILGAAWNNGQGGAGVAPNARFIALRTCWDGDQCYQYLQPDAFNWAADRGARVISLSWLAERDNDVAKSIASHRRVLFVTIPSGNGGAFNADPTHPFPCGLDQPNVLCVSTSSPSDGLDCGAFGPKTVDVAAPTRNSITTINGGGFGPTGCATSWASPTAAGLATVLFGAFPNASPSQVRRAIIAGARNVRAWRGKSVSGGILDAVGAVRSLRRIIAGGGGGKCLGAALTKSGTDGPNTIQGTNGRDVIDGKGGDDTIRGLAGNDLLCGGAGDDTINAGGGDDRLSGGDGRDVLLGGDGGDDLFGGAGVDRLDGGAGNDFCDTGPGNDFDVNCQRVR